ncbi:MAG: helix-turn-helix transcriptional regulator [Chloroflexi bacterium]|nr:helix-turn-helix transcriptional regulator [Chloroflexota bacterium]
MRRSTRAPRVWLNPVAVWELLDRLGISQNELARRCGFSPGHLSMLMNGKRSPSPRVRRNLMEVLGVDDFDLLFITEPPQVEGRRPEETGVSTRKKGPTNAKTAAQAVASGRGRTR